MATTSSPICSSAASSLIRLAVALAVTMCSRRLSRWSGLRSRAPTPAMDAAAEPPRRRVEPLEDLALLLRHRARGGGRLVGHAVVQQLRAAGVMQKVTFEVSFVEL